MKLPLTKMIFAIGLMIGDLSMAQSFRRPPGGPRPPQPPTPIYSPYKLRVTPDQCFSDYTGLCVAQAQFRMSSSNEIGLVTVTELSEGNYEKVFACHQGQSPRIVVPWIKRYHHYQFKLYSVRSCEDTFGGALVDQVMVEGL